MVSVPFLSMLLGAECMCNALHMQWAVGAPAMCDAPQGQELGRAPRHLFRLL